MMIKEISAGRARVIADLANVGNAVSNEVDIIHSDELSDEEVSEIMIQGSIMEECDKKGKPQSRL